MANNTHTFYGLPLGVNENYEVVILNDSFEYSDGFKGCTGEIIRPVFEDEYVDRLSEEHLEEYAEEIWREQVSQSNGPTCSLEEWVEENRADLESSAIEEYDFNPKDYPELTFDTPEDIECWELIGCGRIFGLGQKITQRTDQYDELIKVLKDHDEL